VNLVSTTANRKLVPAKPEAVRSESVKRIACLSGEDACAMAAA